MILRKLGRGVLYAVLALVMLVGGSALWTWATDHRLVFHDRQPFYKGAYFAYAQPWGGAGGWLSGYSGHADKIRVDPSRFPADTGISWRWPWLSSTHGGVWGYNVVGYGNYDGGAPETPVPPRRVDDITVLKQRYAWDYSTPFGSANLLTEFYLRANPADAESKLIEIGWFLHTPGRSARYAAKGKAIGSYVDAAGVRWNVTIQDRYCMIVPADRRDLLNGELDMLATLKWLRAKGVISGREWFTGVAFGVEPIWGVGRARIDQWAVDYR